jgi:RNA-directed DNA polymerase
MMNGSGKSDRPIVPTKPLNNAEGAAAEVVEGRDRTKGNSQERNALRTQSRAGAPSALERVCQAAREDGKQRFTALLHHVYDVERLRAAFLALKRDAAAGIDGETWRHYREGLEANLQDLAVRLKRGAYRQARSQSVHPQERRQATPAGRAGAGGQDRPARRSRGAECDLRRGLPRLLVRVPTRAQSAASVGCARRGNHDEEGEVGGR